MQVWWVTVTFFALVVWETSVGRSGLEGVRSTGTGTDECEYEHNRQEQQVLSKRRKGRVQRRWVGFAVVLFLA